MSELVVATRSFFDFLKSSVERNKNLASCYVWWMIGLRLECGLEILSAAVVAALLLKYNFFLDRSRKEWSLDRLPIAFNFERNEFERDLSSGASSIQTNNNNPSYFSSSSHSRYSKCRHKRGEKVNRANENEPRTSSTLLLIPRQLTIFYFHCTSRDREQKRNWNKVRHRRLKVARNLNGTSFLIFHYFDAPHRRSFYFMCLAFLAFYDPQRRLTLSQRWRWWKWFFFFSNFASQHKYVTTKKVLHASRH